jgi:hypothetical protein
MSAITRAATCNIAVLSNLLVTVEHATQMIISMVSISIDIKPMITSAHTPLLLVHRVSTLPRMADAETVQKVHTVLAMDVFQSLV